MKKNSIIKKIATLTLAASLFSFTGGSNIIDFNDGASNVITVSASASGTGTYMVNTSAGSNVRSSASSSGSKVGAAANGVKFNVTNINGIWGYTPSIQTTNGMKSGWVCLTYCTKVNSAASIEYKGHVQNIGDVASVSNGATLGTTGQGLRLEELSVRLSGVSGGIAITPHLENYGWMNEISAGSGSFCTVGTHGRSLRLEAVKIRLTGQAANEYTVRYRAHIQDKGWLNWVENGAVAGTTGESRRMEAIEIQLVKKTSITNSTALSYGLYKNSNARITCGFDGYVNIKGRHEGIDINCYMDAPVYSLTDGVITNVVYGKEGSSGLSTIAIYNEKTNKTVVYLHSAPISGLREGNTIKKGDEIASESWRGISSPSDRHTHIEVRDGKKTCAAKSVNDYTLDNPNPTSFWNSQGYIIK